MQKIPPIMPLNLRGMLLYPGFVCHDVQCKLVEDLRSVVGRAPFVTPVLPSGKPMSVRMTSAGKLGWVSSPTGYRYCDRHPHGQAWPDIPTDILSIWADLAETDRAPECCLINYYKDSAKMGLHQDRDEADFEQPVVSISLGDDALFRVGNLQRGGKTESVWLKSGDVLVMRGAARLLHHGVDRIKPNSSTLLRQGGRLNLTLRVVT